jgi:hypothetical protein
MELTFDPLEVPRLTRHRAAVTSKEASMTSRRAHTLVGSPTSDTTSGTRSMPAFRSLVSVLVSFVGRSFSTLLVRHEAPFDRVG